jgi:RNA polymerase sigma factor (TIGR02999 family)
VENRDTDRHGTRDDPRVGQIAEIFDELRRAGRSEEEIFVSAYRDLKQLARKMIAVMPAGPSMNGTRLVNDVWMRVFHKHDAEFDWESGAHFYHVMAIAMKRLLIDHNRRRRAHKRGEGKLESLDQLTEKGQSPDPFAVKKWFQEKADQTEMIDETLNRLEREHERLARVIHLRIYAGLSVEETAKALGVGPRTINSDFAKAKAHLKFYLSELRA